MRPGPIVLLVLLLAMAGCAAPENITSPAEDRSPAEDGTPPDGAAHATGTATTSMMTASTTPAPPVAGGAHTVSATTGPVPAATPVPSPAPAWDGLAEWLPGPSWSPAWELLPPRLLDDYANITALGLGTNPGALPEDRLDGDGAVEGWAAVYWRTDDPGADALVATALRFADASAAAAWAAERLGPRVVSGDRVLLVLPEELDPREPYEPAATRDAALSAVRQVQARLGGTLYDDAPAGEPCGKPREEPAPFRLDARRFSIEAADLFVAYADGRASDLAASPAPYLRGDPGSEAYHSIEFTWWDAGIQHRWYAYLHSDGESWWSDEMRVYDGLEPGEWQYAYGDFFRTPVGSAYEADCVAFSFPGGMRFDGAVQSDAVLVLRGVVLEAFLPDRGPHETAYSPPPPGPATPTTWGPSPTPTTVAG